MSVRIERVLNNNAVVSMDSQGREIVVIGAGIAFKKKYGGYVADDKIQKIFHLSGQQNQDRFSRLLERISEVDFEIAQQVINLSTEGYGIELNESALVSLADHFDNAVQRANKGIILDNELTHDIRRIYVKEFEIGQYAVRLINQTHKTTFSDDEAAFIAMHILDNRKNAETSTSLNKVIHLVEQLQHILTFYFHQDLDESSLEYSRLITHLEFFAQRVFRRKQRPETNDMLWKMLTKTYPRAAQAVQRVGKFLIEKYDYSMTKTDQAYLIIHVATLFEKD